MIIGRLQRSISKFTHVDCWLDISTLAIVNLFRAACSPQSKVYIHLEREREREREREGGREEVSQAEAIVVSL